jgi:2-polyprenyl-3-methyl-5-hydroxy-6-metoxy-1,4-benzoquinol methylase/phosphoglycolate phosphatase-like HAD superfamily hydrolase
MKLAIFEVDQALTQTDAVDTQCFLQAFSDEFQIDDINANWAAYGHTTDSGIALQIMQERCDRAPTAEEMIRLQQRFVELLQAQIAAAPRCTALPGAAELLQRLRQLPDWTVALTTSGWRSAAQIKLQAAGLRVTELLMATADDGISREAIVKQAIARASTAQQEFTRIVCVGAGVWEAMTAAQLQLPFVGVGRDRQAAVLQELGVEQIVADFCQFEGCLHALNAANVPDSQKLAQIQQQVFQQPLPPSYFEALYLTQPDPWGFETSAYEVHKYAATIAALPRARYRSALEIGCSIGVLTEQLANRCESLLAIDVSQQAIDRAKQRCQNLPQVRFERMAVPDRYPDQRFDLVLVSEVGYYWGLTGLQAAQQQTLEHLEPGGHLLLVHWTGYARDYPLSGDEVHEAFLHLTPTKLRHLAGQRQEQYRLDLFERL